MQIKLQATGHEEYNNSFTLVLASSLSMTIQKPFTNAS
jgi:hypothetical protein